MRLLKTLKELFKKKPVPVPTAPATPTILLPPAVTKPITVAVMNHSTVLSDTEVQAALAALQIQVSRDFAPAYGIDANLIFVGKNQKPTITAWQLIILDDSDQAGALGYHDLTAGGLPLGKMFAKSDLQSGSNWTITMSHELLELLADPWINLTVFEQSNNTSGKLLAYEVCDACEADNLGYQINGIWVSDFVYPAWFGIPGSTTRLDHMGHIKTPGALLPGGYIGVFSVTKGGGWTQVTAEKSMHAHREAGMTRHGSRRERRARGPGKWIKSL